MTTPAPTSPRRARADRSRLCGGPGLLLAALLALATACPGGDQQAAGGGGDDRSAAGPKAQPAVVLGFSGAGLDVAQITIEEGLVSRAEARGWRVVRANAYRDSRKQAAQIDYLLRRGIDALVVVPVDSREICDAVGRARSQGTLVFTIDRAPLGCEVDMVVMADNREGAAQAGRALVRLLRERYGEARGVVLELQGDLRQNVALERHAGFAAVVSAHPGIEVIQRETQWRPAAFAEATEAVLAERDDLDAIYLHSDAVGVPVVLPILAAHERLRRRGEPGHIVVVGFDGSPPALRAMREGYVEHCSSQPLADYGIVVEWIARVLDGGVVRPGVVERAGAPWSPAHVERADVGWRLLLPTTPVGPEGAADDRLWGNRPAPLTEWVR